MLEQMVNYDSDIIPDDKERLLKEAFHLFRIASNLHDAAFTIENAIRWQIKDSKIKVSYNIAYLNVIKERDATVLAAIEKYNKSKEL
jgi:hypothetical protein